VESQLRALFSMIKTSRRKELPGRIGHHVDFGLEEVTFKPHDVPPHAQAAHAHIEKWTKADALGSEKQAWNGSTIGRETRFPDPCMRRVLSTGCSIKPMIDPRAEVLSKRDPVVAKDTSKFRFDETQFTKTSTLSASPPQLANTSTRFIIPVHPDLAGKTPWNLSTTTSTADAKKERAKLSQLEMLKSRANSTKRIERSNAPSLVQREKQHMRTLRAEKTVKAGGTLPPKLGEGTLDFDEFARETVIQENQMPMDIVYSLDWKKKEYEHLGDWKYSELERCEAWSCCMNTRFDGPGCSVQKPKVTKGWNLTSF